MPVIIVLESSVGSEKEVDVPEGGELVDLADDHRLPIGFSCRSASCGACHCEVKEGAELLGPIEEDEQDLLDVLGGPDGARLACQAVVKAGDGRLVLKPVE